MSERYGILSGSTLSNIQLPVIFTITPQSQLLCLSHCSVLWGWDKANHGFPLSVLLWTFSLSYPWPTGALTQPQWSGASPLQPKPSTRYLTEWKCPHSPPQKTWENKFIPKCTLPRHLSWEDIFPIIFVFVFLLIWTEEDGITSGRWLPAVLRITMGAGC